MEHEKSEMGFTVPATAPPPYFPPQDPAHAQAPYPYPDQGQGQGQGQSHVQQPVGTSNEPKSAISCAGQTVRTWTIVGMYVDMLELAFFFVALTHAWTSLQSHPDDGLHPHPHHWGWYDDLFGNLLQFFGHTFLVVLMALTAFSFVLPAIALYGVEKKNTFILTCWIALQILGIFLSEIRFIFMCIIFQTGGFLWAIAHLIVNIFFVVVTVRFRKELVQEENRKGGGAVEYGA